ncbi:MAG: sigma-70 family RNA polymerase sigma factor [Candidatus Poribacteria bacterium]|nr:sigma-70 family RNA polymerase sigma factor [Candidatus Poribacteria bacterium]
MALRCQLTGIKCPPYKHQGIFLPDNETVKSFLPDLTHCAACIANAVPRRNDLREDLLQVASLTLIDKGPTFNPEHESGANFRSFIRVRICGALMDAKKREVRHSTREGTMPDEEWNPHKTPDSTDDPDIESLWQFPDPHAEFENRLVRDISFASVLPKLLKVLTPRERKVFIYLRENRQNHEIAKALNVSKSRVSQLVAQVTLKLTSAAQRFGLAE